MLKQASTNKVRLLDLLMITIGCGVYALGFVKINIANRLAEGGVTGISLIIYHLFHVDPSISGDRDSTSRKPGCNPCGKGWQGQRI